MVLEYLTKKVDWILPYLLKLKIDRLNVQNVKFIILFVYPPMCRVENLLSYKILIDYSS
jgi:hypothetical protein